MQMELAKNIFKKSLRYIYNAFSRDEAGPPTATSPKNGKVSSVISFWGSVYMHSDSAWDTSARKGLNNETTVPPKLLSMNLLTFKQFGILWLFQYVEVMTWSRKFTKTLVLFYFPGHPVFQGIYPTVRIPERIPKMNYFRQRRET